MAVNMFHLHINALCLGAKGRERLKRIGFEVRNFESGSLGITHFVPKMHLTLHERSSSQYKSLFAKARLILSSDERFLGFLEGEYLAVECTLGDLPEGAGEPRMPSGPFVVLFQNPQRWRQAEIHVSLRRRELSLQFKAYFISKGFYSAQITKNGDLFNIFTMQGNYRTIRAIYDRIKNDFAQSQQKTGAHMKLERSAGYYLSPGFNWLPMQAYAVLEQQVNDSRQTLGRGDE